MGFKSKITPNIGSSSTPSTLTPVITGTQTVTVIGLSIANTTSNNITVSAQIIKNAVVAYLVKNATVLPGGALVVVGGDQKVVLEVGDSITAYSSVATSADAVISYLI